MVKIPTCKICGRQGHYAYACWQNPKRGKNLKKRYEKAFRNGKTPKHDKVLARQSLDRKRLILELDKYCSLIVRIKASDKFGVCDCYCCGKRLPWKQVDCAHYVSRQHLQSRFDLDSNLRVNCTNCNRVLRGNLGEYRKHLVREIGEEKVKELETRPPRKISTPELEEILKQVKRQYKELVEEKKQARS